jgi:hypothetical protein
VSLESPESLNEPFSAKLANRRPHTVYYWYKKHVKRVIFDEKAAEVDEYDYFNRILRAKPEVFVGFYAFEAIFDKKMVKMSDFM